MQHNTESNSPGAKDSGHLAKDRTRTQRMSDAQQWLILENTRDYAIFTTDLERRIISWNAGAQVLFGYTEEEILGQSGDILFTPEDRKRGAPVQEAETALHKGRAENERWHSRKDQSQLYGSGVTTPLRDEAGTTIGLVKIMRDLTPQKQAEEALRESEKRLRLAIKAANMGTWEWDLVTNDVYWNDRHFWLFGMKPIPNPIGPDVFLNHVHPDDRSRIKHQLQVAIDERVVFDAEFCVVMEDGSTRWMSGYGRVVDETDGKATRMSGVIFDINERKRTEEALKEASRRKDEFLALLAHELRNPMATLHNTLLILQLTGGTDPNLSLSAAVVLMNREVAHLVHLVDDLLDVSRISRGKVALLPERVDLVPVVQGVVETAKGQFQAIDRHIAVTLPKDPVYITGDATRLTQVVSNLLSNAAKFTHEGGHIGVRLDRTDSEAILRISDDGIGIPADQLSKIFDMFVQVDTSLGRSQGGLGLGLTLARELVGLHGGRIEARSEGENLGSEFIVYLPLHPNDATPTGEDQGGQSTASPNRRVLVIDDNRDAATTLAMLLKLTGNEVHVRFNGQEGVDAIESLKPQVALIDISMPGLDGYQTCRLIREHPWGKKMLLIALSGYGQEEDKRRSREAGFDSHLVKPVDLSRLNELIAANALNG